ncbi:UNKNOWN [Stylonychia lemnae]|uniref:Uncharacterized protein n=1 Tax=Stylonychia lemnae TaxID=5949 RepID=A0A078A832_STYLE|nr:UNKNOWN [Stylonychia lemnae]|eukprot:CDW76936.1 UNKNOWN [Stylonychia lemnae]
MNYSASPTSGLDYDPNPQLAIDRELNENYIPRYQRFAPRFKPYTLEDVEIERNQVYPFNKPKAPIENTYINYLPHQNPYNSVAHFDPLSYQAPYNGANYPYPYQSLLPYGQFAPNVIPQHYVAAEKQKSFLDTLKRQQLDLKLKIEVEKLEQAKKILEAEVYRDLKKKMKKEYKRQKRDLNDKDDIEMMEVIKKHHDHLQNLGEGIEDNHMWLLIRENDIQQKKADQIGLAHEIRQTRIGKERVKFMKKAEEEKIRKKMEDIRRKQEEIQRKLREAAEKAEEEQQMLLEKKQNQKQRKKQNRENFQKQMQLPSNPLHQTPGLRSSQSQKLFTAASKKSAYAGIDPHYAPHPHYYPPFPLPDEGQQFYFPPLS